MNVARQYRRAIAMASALFLLLAATVLQAHIMVEQHGTLNFANGGAFLVLSIPVSAFDGIDENNDNALSAQELGQHAAAIEQRIHTNVLLLDATGETLPLQGLMLSLSPLDHDPGGPATHLIALGRYPVGDPKSAFGLRINLPGKAQTEREIELTVTRNGQIREMVFTPANNYHSLFPRRLTAHTD
jgi:hypothetical protein